MSDIYAAHINDSGEIQSIKAHLDRVAELASGFAAQFAGGNHADLCSKFHDIGKYSERFQKRIFFGGNRVDHSTAGAIEISKSVEEIGFLLAYCIAGHHGGLPDGGSRADTADEPTLHGRLRKSVEPYMKYRDEMTLDTQALSTPLPIRPLEKYGFSISFYIRMLFSCLVDADYLDTEEFMSGAKGRGSGEKIEVLCEKIEQYIKTFSKKDNDLNRKRDQILHDCIRKSAGGKGIYSLTVPTGGGKTVSSMAFALKHAKAQGMDRVIYVIPYNSIIEQNSAVFKGILGEGNVLEHHSNFSFDKNDGFDEGYALAAENWDMPVIVTTMVQFFESLFSNKASKCRKLHNIANSVIIFDEAQMLPVPYLIPCVRAISELYVNYGCTIVLCTATQPALNKLLPEDLLIREICDDVAGLFQFFKRTQMMNIGELDDQKLAERLNGTGQALCIVNSRKQAQNVFQLLKGEGSFHLSTFMYPLHRKKVLGEIRARLEEGLPCRVISTSLIEAGVDVDFPIVYRAEAGLDSEIQAAGRCNREGKKGVSPVCIFKPAPEYQTRTPEMLKRPTAITHSIESQFEDASTQKAITEYFLQLYTVEGKGLDAKGIVKSLEDGFEEGLSFPFEKISEEFKLIENNTIPIIIPADDEAIRLVERYKRGEPSRQLMRRIQQYGVNVYPCNQDALYGMGSIEMLEGEIAVLTDMSKYSDLTGLDASTDSGQGIFY
jgi:CRISPR-associated endonuclease/helicase Cas3